MKPTQRSTKSQKKSLPKILTLIISGIILIIIGVTLGADSRMGFSTLYRQPVVNDGTLLVLLGLGLVVGGGLQLKVFLGRKNKKPVKPSS